jgi:alanine dehydrogenase
MKIAIIKERKIPADKRAVLSPKACKNLLQTYPDLSVKVESSDIRTFTDDDYQKTGIPVTNDISDCDVLLGVKEVPIEALIPNKKYFFFSHTIKKQQYNRKLLQTILEKNIELYDHEVIVDKNHKRLIGFGYYAGIVGTYNGFRAYGLKHNLFELPYAEEFKDKKELIQKLQDIQLPAIKIVLTGTGRVGMGAKEILDAINIQQVSKSEFLHTTFTNAVYTQLDALDYNKRRDGLEKDISDFFENPQEYESSFFQFAHVADLYIAGHFWDEEAPLIISKENTKHPDFNISVIADISCDVNGPIASTIRSSTIKDPIYGYDPFTEKETDYNQPNAVAVMAVDNLPCELPKDASEGFGEMFTKHVIPAFFNDDKDGILERALMTHNGKLTKNFAYLQDYVDGK